MLGDLLQPTHLVFVFWLLLAAWAIRWAVRRSRQMRLDRERLAELEARADLHTQTQDVRTHPAAKTPVHH